MVDWLGIPAAFIAWGFALYVYAVAPPSRSARFLIAMLMVDGLAVITGYYNSLYYNPFLVSLGLPEVPTVLHQMSDWALVAVYLPFLGMTLNTPLVRPLKHPQISAAILYGGLGFALLLPFLEEDVRLRFNFPFYVVICISLLWGFLAAIHSWHIAANDTERDRARAFTIAFGVRDILWTFTFTVFAIYYFEVGGTDADAVLGEDGPWRIWVPLLYQLAVIIYVPLVAYGVLRVQLFDIDLRLKRTLKRGTITAAFVATFFIISELAGNFLSAQLGAVLGVLATGALVFFLDPLQRAAERLSDAAMPNTVDTPQYQAYRKLQVYDSALKAALDDGVIGERERLMLDSMITSLGIDAEAARQLERDASGNS